MIKPLSMIAALLSVALSFAQPITIKVLDNDNLQPIGGVYLYDNEGGIDSTNARGRATLRELKDDATVLFKRRLYKSAEVSYSTLKKNRTVTLVRIEEPTGETVFKPRGFVENKDSIPNKVLVLDRRNFDRYNPQTSSDILASSDEIFVQKSQQGAGSPMIRGFTANSLAYSIDGVRMNNALYRSDNLLNLMSLDPNAVENAEAVFGPGSTLHGSGAMGGAINFHFTDPVFSPDGSFVKSGSLMGRFASANMEKTGSATVNLSGKNIASLTTVSFSDFGDLRMGNDSVPLLLFKSGEFYDSYSRKSFVQGRARIDRATGKVFDSLVENEDPAVQKNSGFHVFNVLEKTSMAITGDVLLKGSVYFSLTGNVPRYDRLLEPLDLVNPIKYAEWYYGPERWLFSDISIDYSNPQPFFSSARATLSYQNCNESDHSRIISTALLKNDTAAVNVVSASLDCDKPLGEKSVLTYGIETSYNSVSSAAGQENIATEQINRIGTQYPDGGNDYVTGDIYGYYKTRWNPTVTSVAGARYSRFYLHSSFKEPLYNFPGGDTRINAGAPSGCLGVIVTPFDFWRMTLNGSTGFRAPAISDFSGTSGDLRVLHNDLRPEYVYSFDFGNKVELGKNVSLEATTFASHAQNLLTEGYFAYNGYAVPTLANSGSADLWGGDLNFEIRFTSGFSLRNTVTFMAGLDSNLLPLRAVPPLFGASHFLFKVNRIKGDFYVRYNGEKTQGTQPTDMIVADGESFLYPLNGQNAYFSPSWFTLNLATSMPLTAFLNLNVAVENILNKCYRPYANGITAPGINIVCSVRGTI